jgi:hypothetical protein
MLEYSELPKAAGEFVRGTGPPAWTVKPLPAKWIARCQQVRVGAWMQPAWRIVFPYGSTHPVMDSVGNRSGDRKFANDSRKGSTSGTISGSR